MGVNLWAGGRIDRKRKLGGPKDGEKTLIQVLRAEKQECQVITNYIGPFPPSAVGL